MRGGGILSGLMGLVTAGKTVAPSIDRLKSGDINGAINDLETQTHAMVNPMHGSQYFYRYTVPTIGLSIFSKVATSWGINPGVTFGKGKKAFRIRLF